MAAKPYVLLRRALARDAKVAVAKFAWHNRERLGLLSVRDDALVLHSMKWPDEVRDPSELAPNGIDLDEDEIQRAIELMDSMTTDDISGYREGTSPTSRDSSPSSSQLSAMFVLHPIASKISRAALASASAAAWSKPARAIFARLNPAVSLVHPVAQRDVVGESDARAPFRLAPVAPQGRVRVRRFAFRVPDAPRALTASRAAAVPPCTVRISLSPMRRRSTASELAITARSLASTLGWLAGCPYG